MAAIFIVVFAINVAGWIGGVVAGIGLVVAVVATVIIRQRDGL
jgi:hypothetical protein